LLSTNKNSVGDLQEFMLGFLAGFLKKKKKKKWNQSELFISGKNFFFLLEVSRGIFEMYGV